MRRCAEGINHHGVDLQQPPSAARRIPDPDRLTSLAALNLARQTPGLVLPSLAETPTSYAYTRGSDASLVLAASLVKLGLGTTELWTRHNANPSLFIRSAVNDWLGSLGANELPDYVSFDLAIVDQLEGMTRPEDRRLLILIETSDGCGFLAVGDALAALEIEEAGLGRSFYIILLSVMDRWMEIYDSTRTECFLDHWKESIEMDIEDGDGSEEAFERYCREHDISFPDLRAATPECVRDIEFYRERKRLGRHFRTLKQHRDGKHGEWIEAVLAMVKAGEPEEAIDFREIDGVWDDGPLPNWMVAFHKHDPITQAFDDEAQQMYETTHAPTWLRAFDPADLNSVRLVLHHVERLVQINRQLAHLCESFERSKGSGSSNKSHLNQELRAA
jgi:hypothetical protein